MKPNYKKFNDLRAEDINFDFQIHTNWTDGQSSPEEMIKKAIELKLESIAFTEHVNKTSDWFDNFADKINTLKSSGKVKIFLGIEAKAIDFDGTIDATPNMIAQSDIVLGVIHRYPNGQGGYMSLEEMQRLGQTEMADIELNLSMGLLKNKNVDVVGHPFGMYAKLYADIPENHIKQLLIEIVKQGKAIEINTKYLPNIKLFFNLLKQSNPYVSIGSDAHHKDELTRSYDLVRNML